MDISQDMFKSYDHDLSMQK